MSSDQPILRVEGLSTHFHTRNGLIRAVDDVSFSLRRGEMLGLVGESGCGKTMTALSVLRLVPSPGRIVSGRVWLDDLDLLTLSRWGIREIRGSEISMIFQEPLSALNPSFTIGWQISEVYKLNQPELSSSAIQKEVVDILRAVGLPDAPKRQREYPHQFSGGMRQRVLIAIALAARPSILLADEPTTALDVTIQAETLDLIEGLSSEFQLSTILISHDLNLVVERCDRVMVMYAGKMVEMGPSLSLYFDPIHPYTKGLLDSIPRLGATRKTLNPIPGEVPDLAGLPSGCPFAPRCEFSRNICWEECPEFEQLETNRWARCYFPLGRA